MDITLYLSHELSASLVTEKTGLAPTDLMTLLDVSAGLMTTTTVYRPYYVAAKLLATRKTQLSSAEGAEFVDPLKVAEEYLRLQRAIDGALGLVVPPGAEALMTSLGQRATAVSGTVEVIGTW